MTEYIISVSAETIEKNEDGATVRITPNMQEIVRCRDCKHAYEATWPADYQVPPDYLDCGGPLVETWDYYNDEPKDNPVPPDGFCFYGERREDD